MNTVRLGYAGAVVLLVGGFVIWRQVQPEKKSAAEVAYLPVPGNHLWASQWHDAQGTRWVKTSGPKTKDILWTYLTEGHFVGGPVVASDGRIYAATDGNYLVAVSPEGKEIWRSNLSAPPVGTPALGPAGEVYVSDVEGGLTAFSPGGELLWRFIPKGGREGTSGPIVDSKGNIYYTRVDSVQAVSPDGTPWWLGIVFDGYAEEPPVISAGGGYIFLVNGASSAKSGAPLNLGYLTGDEIKLTTPAFFIGADGDTYIRTGNGVVRWVATDEGVKTDPPIMWNNSGGIPMPPISQGTTPDGLIWLFYSSDFSETRLVWLDKSSRLVSNTGLWDRQSELIAIDENSIAYICSDNLTVGVNCKAMQIGIEDPIWELDLGDNLQVMGGAVVPGRMYITTNAGALIAVGKSGESRPSVSDIDVANITESPTMPPATSIPATPMPLPTPPATATHESSLSVPESTQDESLKLFFPFIQR